MGVAPGSDARPAQLRAAVVEGSGRAFMNGLHAASVVTGPLCVAGGVLAAVGIRKSARRRLTATDPPAAPRSRGRPLRPA
uniref:hypothetical protein n=1 Tax=Streptomyces asoensis TaxID=249586 RepID=UPI001C0F37CE